MKNCNDIIHYEIYFNSTNKSYGWGCIKIKKKKKNYISNNSERLLGNMKELNRINSVP